MLKIKTTLAILVLTASLAQGQIVPSSCSAPDSIRAKYQSDAYRITLRRLLRNQSNYQDTVAIPQAIIDTTLHALMAIYNATVLPARDTVVKMNNVHTLYMPDLNTLSLTADSNLVWMQNIRKGILPTGDATIDFLLNKYGLKKQSYYAFKSLPYHSLTLTTDSNYNMAGLAKLVRGISGVFSADPNQVPGDGNNITDSIYADHIQIVYSIGWHDCPSGCIDKRFWKFNVYWDCSVAFDTSYGSTLPYTGVKEIDQGGITIYPNPFVDAIYVDHHQAPFAYRLTNLVGQEMKRGVSSATIEGLTNLQAGIYILHIQAGNKVWTQKILKQ
jgi:hypothetical protein